MTGALAGIRVLDTSSLAPGGYATLLLAEAGAEVIKVERPNGGDPARGMIEGVDLFTPLNRGKKSVVLDLKSKDGLAAFDRLVETADVVVENYLPRNATRLGVVYERLRTVKPDIILCSVTGYDRGGPLGDQPGHDLNFLARAGALGFLQPPGVPDAVPILPVSDLQGGTAAAFAIATALVRRALTGAGDHVRIALTGALVHGWTSLGLAPEQQVWVGGDPARAGYAIYPTADGRRLAVATEETRFWHGLCEMLGRPDLADRDHMAADEDGIALRAEVAELIAERSLAEWLELAGDAVPVTEVADAAEARDAWAGPGGRRALVDGTHPASPLAGDAPRLGEHDSPLLG
ncbi:MAG TPA: CaiB/BaiF CoA-transferase family protein [Pseudolysinimonas sp.]|nr:CaiB/BaiF CoA-transferase family protein [Pseudolysinimonas sp.]